MGPLVMELDLIEDQSFYFQTVDLVKMYYVLEQIWVFLQALIIKKDILVLGIGPTQGLEHTSTAEKMYSVNFTVTKKEFCLSLHYNGANSYLFVNGTEIYNLQFKAKDSEIVATAFCLGNIFKDWSLDNMKTKTCFNGYVYDFSVDYDAADVDDTLDIHKYLMKKK